MSTELTRTEPAPINFTAEQVQLLKDTICKGATNDELSLFMLICNRKQLDPFAKQIYAIKRWDKDLNREVMTYQTGIDGFRLLAERTGRYAGQGAPQWCGPDGAWKDVWLEKTAPSAAKATVFRSDWKEPMVRVAHFGEYAQVKRDGITLTSMWSKMKASQLFKCAEALALRSAFPEELSGLHSTEEMQQADEPENEPPLLTQKPAQPASEGLRRAEAPPSVKTASEPIPEDVARLWAGMGSINNNVTTMHKLRQELADLIGHDAARRKYVEVLGKAGVEHANQFKSVGDAKRAARELFEAIKALNAPLHVTEADIPEAETAETEEVTS